jgi:hypothetical protein
MRMRVAAHAVESIMSSLQHPDVPARPVTERIASRGNRRPLYQREPWLAVLLASLVLMSIAIFLPHELRRFAIYIGLGVGAIGVILLMIHKPDPAEDPLWQEHQRDQ